MSLFTEEQLRELETVFGLTREESLPVRDGRVVKSSLVWWRDVDGPKQITAEDQWKYIREFRAFYSVKEPRFTVTYLD